MGRNRWAVDEEAGKEEEDGMGVIFTEGRNFSACGDCDSPRLFQAQPQWAPTKR